MSHLLEVVPLAENPAKLNKISCQSLKPLKFEIPYTYRQYSFPWLIQAR